jgi:hypothetical protein
MAAPVLAVDALGRPSDEQLKTAVTTADRLLVVHSEDLPELASVLEAPLSRLQQQRLSRELAAPAFAAASVRPPDAKAMRQAVEAAERRASDAPAAVRRLVAELCREATDQGAIAMARQLARDGRPAQARKLLRRRAAERDEQALPASAPATPAPAVGVALASAAAVQADMDMSQRSPAEQLRFARKALVSRDLADLRGVVTLRAGEGWPADLARAMDDHVHAACEAVASLEATAASAEARPGERARLWLEALTCDEVLPPPFVEAARTQAAAGFLAAALAGGDVEPAAAAWSALPETPERDQALATLALLSESRGLPSRALDLWSVVDSEAVFTQALAQPEPAAALAALPPLETTPPAVAYPYMPDWPASLSADASGEKG